MKRRVAILVNERRWDSSEILNKRVLAVTGTLTKLLDEILNKRVLAVTGMLTKLWMRF